MSAKSVPLAGVIGHPVGHSKSPRLHGYWLKKYNISGHYVPMDVEPHNLEQVLRALTCAGFVGANVTIPHKEALLQIADEVSERARRIGSANTLFFSPDGRIQAESTDGFGFLENLRQAVPDWRPDSAPAAIIGAGGASRAVIDALLEAGVPELRLTNRTTQKAEALATLFGSRVRVVDWADAGTMIEGAGTIVNATSLGMVGQPPMTLDLEAMAPGTLATDLVYVPCDTPFLRAARERGARTVDGVGMLLYQAQAGFARWFGVMPEVDSETRRTVLAP